MNGERTIRRRAHVADVEKARDWLIRFFEEHPLFVSHALHQHSELASDGIGVALKLDDDTSASAYFLLQDSQLLMSHVLSVDSSLKQSTGFLLLHLLLLIAVMIGAKEITLDNDTGQPERARAGIYQLFKTNARRMSPENRARMTPENWLKKPEMVHFVDRTSLPRIQRVLIERIKKEIGMARSDTLLWREDAADNMALMFRKLRQTYDIYSGGRRRSLRGRRGRTLRSRTRRTRRALRTRRIVKKRKML